MVYFGIPDFASFVVPDQYVEISGSSTVCAWPPYPTLEECNKFMGKHTQPLPAWERFSAAVIRTNSKESSAAMLCYLCMFNYILVSKEKAEKVRIKSTKATKGQKMTVEEVKGRLLEIAASTDSEQVGRGFRKRNDSLKVKEIDDRNAVSTRNFEPSQSEELKIMLL